MIAPQIYGGSLQPPGRFDNQVAAFNLHLGAQSLNGPDVQVHGTVTDDAAARQRNHAPLHAGHQGAHQADGGAHLAHLFISGFGMQVPGLHAHVAAGPLHGGAQLAHDLNHEIGIGDIRHTAHHHRLIRQQGCGQNGQGRIFGPADIDGSPQRKTSVYNKLLHSGWQLGDGFYTFETSMQPQRAPGTGQFPGGFPSRKRRRKATGQKRQMPIRFCKPDFVRRRRAGCVAIFLTRTAVKHSARPFVLRNGCD